MATGRLFFSKRRELHQLFQILTSFNELEGKKTDYRELLLFLLNFSDVS